MYRAALPRCSPEQAQRIAGVVFDSGGGGAQTGDFLEPEADVFPPLALGQGRRGPCAVRRETERQFLCSQEVLARVFHPAKLLEDQPRVRMARIKTLAASDRLEKLFEGSLQIAASKDANPRVFHPSGYTGRSLNPMRQQPMES